MSDRTMKAGDTYPPLKGQASDETGVLNLTGAESLEAVIESDDHTVTGTATAIWPPEDDPDGEHHWNWEYGFSAGDDITPADTSEPGDYKVLLRVTWAPGQIQTFPDVGAPMLTIEEI